MRNATFFGVPIALWLFPPFAIIFLVTKLAKETQTKLQKGGKDG